MEWVNFLSNRHLEKVNFWAVRFSNPIYLLFEPACLKVSLAARSMRWQNCYCSLFKTFAQPQVKMSDSCDSLFSFLTFNFHYLTVNNSFLNFRSQDVRVDGNGAYTLATEQLQDMLEVQVSNSNSIFKNLKYQCWTTVE